MKMKGSRTLRNPSGGLGDMLILAIDDEPKMLRLLHKAIEEAMPDAHIMDFPL